MDFMAGAMPLSRPHFGGRGGACGKNFPIDAMGLGKF
jgi:hypothetical protein